MLDFTKIFQLKGLKPKNKDHTSFYKCCDLTKKKYTNLIHITRTMGENIEIFGERKEQRSHYEIAQSKKK